MQTLQAFLNSSILHLHHCEVDLFWAAAIASMDYTAAYPGLTTPARS